jgi:nucleoside-diphosphate-sugar epimerase
MKIIVTGATGFSGGEVLRQALADAEIEEVAVLTRRLTGIRHPKLKEILCKDFLDYSGVELRGYDACIWCLGVSQTQVSKEEYVKITCDYTLAGAQAMFRANPNLRFCFVSGRNADPEEKGVRLFTRIKGRTERRLAALGANVWSFRPGYIRPTAKSGPRKDAARFFAPIGSLLSLLFTDFSVDCDGLAHAMLKVAKHGNAPHLLENRAICALGAV